MTSDLEKGILRVMKLMLNEDAQMPINQNRVTDIDIQVNKYQRKKKLIYKCIHKHRDHLIRNWTKFKF